MADAGDAGYTQARFQTQDGLSIAYRDYAAAGKGPQVGCAPVVCAHGLTRNARDFEELAPRIAALGRRVIVPDARGRGLSDWDPEPARYQPLIYTQDVLALLDELELAQAAWVGTSMGGLMGMIAAKLAPERLASLTLNDIGPEIDPDGLKRIEGYVGGAPPQRDWAAAQAITRSINEDAFPDQNDAFWSAFAHRLFTETSDGAIRLDYDPAISDRVQAGEAAPPDLWALFNATRSAPTLVVRGALSDLLSEATVTRMAARHDQLTIVRAANVGHAPFLTETDVWPALARFLAETP
ncbi:MAG: alpha/beta fold hydrolase [Maricaulaceae bacterium]